MWGANENVCWKAFYGRRRSKWWYRHNVQMKTHLNSLKQLNCIFIFVHLPWSATTWVSWDEWKVFSSTNFSLSLHWSHFAVVIMSFPEFEFEFHTVACEQRTHIPRHIIKLFTLPSASSFPGWRWLSLRRVWCRGRNSICSMWAAKRKTLCFFSQHS